MNAHEDIEHFTSNEVTSFLWNKNSSEKCRIGLADAVIYENGKPARWYVTGKTGEVTKKRSADLEVISQRWLKIAAQYESSTVAILRQDGGILKFLSVEPWQSFLEDDVADKTIRSLHCFIKGENNVVYRNKFKLRDKLGRYTSSTHTYSFKLDRGSSNGVTVMYENNLELVESKASQIKNIMDLATNTIVRYLEMMLSVRMLSLTVDYVIDQRSQIWMLWADDARFVKASKFDSIHIPDLANVLDKAGRMSWAGSKYMEEVGQSGGIGSGESVTDSVSRSGSRMKKSDSLIDSAGRNSVDPTVASALVNTAATVVSEKGFGRETLKRKKSHTTSAYTLKSLHAGDTNPFPQPFKCKGDFCNFDIHSNGDLNTSQASTSKHQSRRLFSEEELSKLRKNKQFSKMVDIHTHAKEKDLPIISRRSIIQARQERRAISTEISTETWNTFPDSPRCTLHGNQSGHDSTRASKEMKIQKDVELGLSKDKEHRESFTKSLSTYYDQVRVCSTCYGIYSLLDWARDVLGESDAHGAGLEGKGAAFRSKVATRPGSVTSMSDIHDESLSLDESAETLKSASTRDLPTYLKSTTASIASQSERKNTENSRRSSIRRKQVVEKSTWKDHVNLIPQIGKETVLGNDFVQLDDYLRGGAAAVAARKATNSSNNSAEFLEESKNEAFQNYYRGKILLACSNEVLMQSVKSILEESYFDVHVSIDGRDAINSFSLKKDSYDCILVERDLALLDCYKVTAAIRDSEKMERKTAAAAAAILGRGVQPATRRHPVICCSDRTKPEDLKSYMVADMDGCISIPIDRSSLLTTVRAAVPHHLATISKAAVSSATKDIHLPKVFKAGPLGEMEGSNDSATMAAKTLPVNDQSESDVSLSGLVQIDADTRLPFIVMDASKNSKIALNSKKPFFNLVVCHDLFDTAERMKIFLKPIVQRYLGMQILIWNYPGQAFTEWREEQLLNNEYLGTCLNEVLGQLGDKGTNDFDTSKPFYLLGYGNGASVASFYASHYQVKNLRGIISVNGWSFLDSYLAGVMHDCINIFQCAPPTRPDLPVYFFSRFLFSKDYLAKVSVPLALNIYTAVHNSISLTGRLNLCKGVLQQVDVRPLLKEIDCPMICIHSTQDGLVRPLHAEPFTSCRGGETRSIFKALRDPWKTCIIWMKGGHEIFQENKKQVQLLIEQILTGFHETHDISFPAAAAVDSTISTQGRIVSNLPWENEKKSRGTLDKTVEDKFIDNVLGSMSKLNATHGFATDKTKESRIDQKVLPSIGINNHNKVDENVHSATSGNIKMPHPTISDPVALTNSIVFSSTDTAAWSKFSQVMAETNIRSKDNNSNKKSKTLDGDFSRVVDPTSAMFERQDNIVYGLKAREVHQQNVHEYPEVKEYMSWRLKRNKKRLQRLQAAARSIQAAFRAHLARKFVRGIRRYKAALFIQRCFRGWQGRIAFHRRAQCIWAAQILQRSWRGYVGRKWYFLTKLKIAAAANIQRVNRGYKARIFVDKLKRIRYRAASIIQAMYRRFAARMDAWRRRLFRNCATTLQRVLRGHLGRKKAASERDKYIFSRSQSQGIEFGRQMLLEHKLHATRLQSDVTLLTQEKVSAEEQIEALLEEISAFEDGVRTLEKEMHQLSKVESEAAAYMDEESKYELREQKIKLDREFGEMLLKISSRKEMLNDLERKLSTIDKSRQGKEEELRTLERKLVVLLEEQQNELNAIKRKQDVRGTLLAASHEELMNITNSVGDGNTSGTIHGAHKSSEGGGFSSSGPSLQEKRQAAQLMQSTETLMKFGFMSMSMTYFSSLNMVKALRTVSAQDTVMAALADVHSQRAVNQNDSAMGMSSSSIGRNHFIPDLKPGQMSGQQVLRVSAWSVDDVAKWMQTLSLGQYSEAFIDAAVDGEFLYDLTDDDLKNTLGIEHRLHRKKVLNCVHRLKLAEAQRDNRLNNLLRETGSLDEPVLQSDEDNSKTIPANPFDKDTKSGAEDRNHIDGPKIPLTELFSLVRHSKLSLLKEALDYLPSKSFDKSLVQASYVVDHGTVYVDGYERLPFHINKTDEHGNTMLTLACQNGNMKICKYLQAKGANLNHQNVNGQTPAHFAIAYKFFEVSHWLFENGGDDTLENKYGLSPYDGLSADGGDESLLAIEN